MGFGSSWLSGLTWNIIGVGLIICILGVVSGFITTGGVDVGWIGTALDRMGTAVCLVWLILFEGAFFFGAVWAWGLVAIDLQGHGVG